MRRRFIGLDEYIAPLSSLGEDHRAASVARTR
jgi:hypothetical protein